MKRTEALEPEKQSYFSWDLGLKVPICARRIRGTPELTCGIRIERAS
jgi:hypothetical protein